ncbi:TcpQ domain-containing protein [Bordetella sp. N]|uniref:TcpQ domain-containing protein n=1 Tax=Bordetella sp. N TaxID=1746199 RepID=UPI001E4BEE8F|nr:TcpQ domain-containing protein [Bordetella sp. N]
MHRISGCLAVLPCVTACAPSAWKPQDVITPGARYDFNWRLSGQRAVAPLQVFDDGHRTWLHFAPEQPLPAIFAVAREGERPVAYQRRDPYVIVDGVWPALIMRGGNLRAVARRQAGPAFDDANTAADAAIPVATPTANSTAKPDALSAQPLPAQSPTASAAPSAQTVATATPAASPHTPSSAPQSTPSNTPPFRAELADGNLRRVLTRWASQAGWTFGPEHWDVDVEIPLAGNAVFGDDFKHAVRALVGATEMAERPLQPCFYANRVLRVVPIAQACDRSATRRAAP